MTKKEIRLDQESQSEFVELNTTLATMEADASRTQEGAQATSMANRVVAHTAKGAAKDTGEKPGQGRGRGKGAQLKKPSKPNKSVGDAKTKAKQPSAKKNKLLTDATKIGGDEGDASRLTATALKGKKKVTAPITKKQLVPVSVMGTNMAESLKENGDANIPETAVVKKRKERTTTHDALELESAAFM